MTWVVQSRGRYQTGIDPFAILAIECDTAVKQ
jgi:hypothetical protein